MWKGEPDKGKQHPERHKKAAEKPWLFEQVAEDTDNGEGVLEICFHHDYFLPCQNQHSGRSHCDTMSLCSGVTWLWKELSEPVCKSNQAPLTELFYSAELLEEALDVAPALQAWRRSRGGWEDLLGCCPASRSLCWCCTLDQAISPGSFASRSLKICPLPSHTRHPAAQICLSQKNFRRTRGFSYFHTGQNREKSLNFCSEPSRFTPGVRASLNTFSKC